MLAQYLQSKQDAALLLMRLALGLVFLDYGWQHVSHVEGFTNAFADRFHIPLAEFSAPFVAWVELLGGLAVILGLFTRYAGLLLANTMVVSTLQVKMPAGLAQGRDPLGLTGFWDLDLSLFALGVALLLVGPGKYSLERMLFQREL
jgi:putative oxidoreductase